MKYCPDCADDARNCDCSANWRDRARELESENDRLREELEKIMPGPLLDSASKKVEAWQVAPRDAGFFEHPGSDYAELDAYRAAVAEMRTWDSAGQFSATQILAHLHAILDRLPK